MKLKIKKTAFDDWVPHHKNALNAYLARPTRRTTITVRDGLKPQYDPHSYHDNIKVDFHSGSQKLTFGLKQWGSFVVDQIELDQESIPVSFMIDLVSRKWGIKDIGLYGIAGKPELDIKVTVFANDKNDEVKTVSTKLPIDWQKIKQDIYENDKTFSLGSLEIYLKNDEKGDLLIDYDRSYINVYHY